MLALTMFRSEGIKFLMIQAKEMIILRQRLNEILSSHAGPPLEIVEQDIDRDYFLDAKGALQYGLIDRIIMKGEDVIHR